MDVLDVSSSGNDPQQKIVREPGYQVPFAQTVKKAVGNSLLVGTIGSITSDVQANKLLNNRLDLVLVGRKFQKNPGLMWEFADELNIEIKNTNQIQ